MTYRVDITGHRFGHLKAFAHAPKRGRQTRWLCECDCGRTTEVILDNLKNGHTRSCGCLWYAPRPPRENLKGQVFGRLKVLKYAGRARSAPVWLCRCACGTKKVIRAHNLKSGASRSCGCQIRVGLLKANITHGKYNTPERRIWTGIKTRCYNENEYCYRYYGARGIKVCQRWLGEKGFQNFLKDVGPRPSPKHSIDRINVDKNYTPANCRWATMEEQANNKRLTIRVRHEGVIVSLKEACRQTGLNYYSVRCRLLRGMTYEEAVTKPFRRWGKLQAAA